MSLRREPSYLFEGPTIAEAFLNSTLVVLVMPTCFVAGVFYTAKRRRMLGFRHRAILTKFLELLVLSQLLVVTTAHDLFVDLACSPDVLGSELGDDWTGNTQCSELQFYEREAVDCSWQYAASRIAIALSAWSGFVCFVGVWSYSQEGRSVKTAEVATLTVLLLVNGFVWFAFFLWAEIMRGNCRLSLGANASALLFTVVSLNLPVAELFIPNTPDFHSAESDPTIARQQHAAGEDLEDLEDGHATAVTQGKPSIMELPTHPNAVNND